MSEILDEFKVAASELVKLNKLFKGNLFLFYSGYPDILKKRLKLYYMESSLGKAGLDSHQTAQSFDYLCVIDFEATCERQNPADYLHEIIEFPIVLVNTKTRLVVRINGTPHNFKVYCSSKDAFINLLA